MVKRLPWRHISDESVRCGTGSEAAAGAESHPLVTVQADRSSETKGGRGSSRTDCDVHAARVVDGRMPRIRPLRLGVSGTSHRPNRTQVEKIRRTERLTTLIYVGLGLVPSGLGWKNHCLRNDGGQESSLSNRLGTQEQKRPGEALAVPYARPPSKRVSCWRRPVSARGYRCRACRA